MTESLLVKSHRGPSKFFLMGSSFAYPYVDFC